MCHHQVYLHLLFIYYFQWQCEECITLNTAIEKREIKCMLSNGTAVDDQLCNLTSNNKPSDQRECINDDCQPTWVADEWSEVCYYYFIITCYYYFITTLNKWL